MRAYKIQKLPHSDFDDMDDLVNLSGLCDGFKIDGWIRANFEVICQERHNHNKILLILTRKRAPGEINTCWIARTVFIDESSYSI